MSDASRAFTGYGGAAGTAPPVSLLDLRKEGFGGLGAPVTTQVVESLAELRLLGEEWDALFQRCPGASACGLHAWIVSWWEAFGEGVYGAERGAALYVVFVRDAEGTPFAAFPLFEEGVGTASLGARRLRAIGSLGRIGVHDMTEGPTALVREGCEAAASGALARLLREEMDRGRWDKVALRLPGGRLTEAVEQAIGDMEGPYAVTVAQRKGTRVATLPETWAEYRRALSKSMRDNLGYYPRLLTRDGRDWAVRMRREPGEMREAAERLAGLHRARYAQLRGPSHSDHIHSPVHQRFLAALLERLASEGRAMVGELTVDGQVVASQAFVEAEGTLILYYSGFLEEYHRYSPVFVIDTVAFQEAQSRGVRRIDFMDASKAWVERWGAAPAIPTTMLTITSRSPGARARLAVEAARRMWAKRVSRRVHVTARRLERGWRRLRAALA